jgi:hypothetical protein
MNVEIGTQGPQFLEKKYINGIFLAVCEREREREREREVLLNFKNGEKLFSESHFFLSLVVSKINKVTKSQLVSESLK